MKEYNEAEAIAHIKAALAAAGESDITEQTIDMVADLIWEGYDELGLTGDIDFDFDDDIDEEEETERMLDFLEQATEGSGLSRKTLQIIYKAETDYEETLF